MIREWNLLRTLACLVIVFLHSTTHISRELGFTYDETMHVLRIIMTGATPTFIVLSEIILANRYGNIIPDQFFAKRIKYLLVPFVAFAFIDAAVLVYKNDSVFKIELLDNLSGLYVGYFILIIFQFYILHYFITKYRISVVKLLPASILIMYGYLELLHSNIPFFAENRAYLKLPFLAWFGYFTIAYLIGKHYKVVSDFARTYKWALLLGAVFSMYVVYMSYHTGDTQVNSRRFDLFPLVLLSSLTVLGFGKALPEMKLVNLISRYAFAIYLLHWQVQILIVNYVVSFDLGIRGGVAVLFFASLAISIAVAKIISLLPLGQFVVGRIKKPSAIDKRVKI